MTATATFVAFCLHDGLQPVQEKRNGQFANILTGAGLDELISRTDASGTRRTFITDALGSVLSLTDDAGAEKTAYRYQPYGATTQSGEASNNTYQYTGRENDGAGLYYYRARYYSSAYMRFMAEDPIGLAGGLNRYAYANGAPLMYIDPEGLQGRSGGAYLPRGTVPSAPVMTENGGVASVRSGMNQFTNMPNPSSNIPGAWSGINYPWSMPRLGKVCVRCAGGSPENSCSRLAGSPNMSMPADTQTCQCVEWNTVQLP